MYNSVMACPTVTKWIISGHDKLVHWLTTVYKPLGEITLF